MKHNVFLLAGIGADQSTATKAARHQWDIPLSFIDAPYLKVCAGRAGEYLMERELMHISAAVCSGDASRSLHLLCQDIHLPTLFPAIYDS